MGDIAGKVLEAHLANSHNHLGRVVTTGVALNAAALLAATNIIANGSHPDAALKMLLMPMVFAFAGAAMGAEAMRAYARLTEIRVVAAVDAAIVEEAMDLKRTAKTLEEWAFVVEKLAPAGDPGKAPQSIAEAHQRYLTQHARLVGRSTEHAKAGERAIEQLWRGHRAALVLAAVGLFWFGAEFGLGMSLEGGSRPTANIVRPAH